VRPVDGSNQPRWPLAWAENQTPPSGAGATSWMPVRREVASFQPCSALAAWAVDMAAPNGSRAPAWSRARRVGWDMRASRMNVGKHGLWARAAR
jgi:hypothetical protein